MAESSHYDRIWWDRELWKTHAKHLEVAGDRLIALISRCSDQATEKQRIEHERTVAALAKIWYEAKQGY
jgi:hypothetical protein